MSRSLVERAQLGDRDAYEDLARGVARSLFLVASRILRDPDAAEDAVQQTLISIWRDLRALRDPERFDAWAYRVLVRHCAAESHRHRRRSGVTIVDLSEAIATPHDDVSPLETRDELARAFGALSVEQRAVVVLHHLVGLPLAEIADIVGVPYGTVGSRLHHAKAAMRAALDADQRLAADRRQPA